MAEQNTDPKSQGQGQSVVVDENEESQAAFGGSDDFFDDPNFLSKIGQGNTSPSVETSTDDVNLGDISHIFDNETITKDIQLNEEIDTKTNEETEEKPAESNLEVKPETIENITEPIIETTTDEVGPMVKQINDEIIENNPEVAIKNLIENEIIEEDNQKAEEVIPEIIPETIKEVVIENGSDFVKKFNELKKTLSEINDDREKLGYDGKGFDVIGANSDRSKITYNFDLDNNTISIQKNEIDKKTEESTEHTLFFKLEEDGLSVGMDELIIFEEKKDLEKDPKKKIQVMDKINKMMFLAGEYQSSIQMELREKQEEEQEKRKMQDIFRNF